MEGKRYTGTAVIVARRIPRDFVPDGDLDKGMWVKAAKVKLGDNAAPEEPALEAASLAAAAWTPSNVYFAFWNDYTELNTYQGEDPAVERWKLWDRDVVEVFINPIPERMNLYWEFEVAPNNQWVDLEIDLDLRAAGKNMSNAAWNSGFLHAARIDAARKQWYCEMRIPVAPMGVKQVRAGMQWRLNFYRADGLGDDTKRRFLSWSPTFGGTFHKPERFGAIRFEKQEPARGLIKRRF